MSIPLRSMAASGRQAPIVADLHVHSSLDVQLSLKRVGPIDRPVDLVRQFKTFGLRLRDAHRALESIVVDETVHLKLGGADRAAMIAEFAELGVAAQ